MTKTRTRTRTKVRQFRVVRSPVDESLYIHFDRNPKGAAYICDGVNVVGAGPFYADTEPETAKREVERYLEENHGRTFHYLQSTFRPVLNTVAESD